jgi:hypothetical protein
MEWKLCTNNNVFWVFGVIPHSQSEVSFFFFSFICNLVFNSVSFLRSPKSTCLIVLRLFYCVRAYISGIASRSPNSTPSPSDSRQVRDANTIALGAWHDDLHLVVVLLVKVRAMAPGADAEVHSVVTKAEGDDTVAAVGVLGRQGVVAVDVRCVAVVVVPELMAGMQEAEVHRGQMRHWIGGMRQPVLLTCRENGSGPCSESRVTQTGLAEVVHVRLGVGSSDFTRNVNASVHCNCGTEAVASDEHLGGGVGNEQVSDVAQHGRSHLEVHLKESSVDLAANAVRLGVRHHEEVKVGDPVSEVRTAAEGHDNLIAAGIISSEALAVERAVVVRALQLKVRVIPTALAGPVRDLIDVAVSSFAVEKAVPRLVGTVTVLSVRQGDGKCCDAEH